MDMGTKIAIKSDSITPFGGIYYVMDEFKHLEMSDVIDDFLGLRSVLTGYQYSEIISSLFNIYYCGGDCVEDIGKHLGSHMKLRPNTRIPSPDTILRGIKELSVDNITYTSDRDSEYEYNTAERLNELMLKMLLQTKQLEKGKVYDIDFDHQFIPTEKYDTVYSYKKERGYFPGVATIGDKIVAIENRGANANVRFHQADTLKRNFLRLEAAGITINRARMDCGSFSEEIIRMVEDHSYNFYIRAARCQSLYQEMKTLDRWKQVEINFESYEVTSMLFTSFMEDCHYRLVIQRQKRKNGETDLFEGEYTYRCILTNDWERSEEEIIKYYNARGASEKTFDQMNNDFGWKYLPCSFLKENTVFLLLTAMAKNFYVYLVNKISKVMEDITPVCRIKKFVFRFISVPAKWVKTGRQWVLNLYTDKPYHLLWDS
jgi:hypothetical protein